MKTLLGLAFFGLIVQIAAGQVVEINSPTTSNLNCILTWSPSPESNNVTIQVFGDNGLGYISKDKCASWEKLDIDPIKKRSIHLAARVNDTLTFISGGIYNDLLKISTDGGITFKDFTVPNKAPIYSLAPYLKSAQLGNSNVAFTQAQRAISVWYNEYNVVESFNVSAWGDQIAYNHATDDCITRFAGQADVNGDGSALFYFVKTSHSNSVTIEGFHSGLFSDSITTIAALGTTTLMSQKSAKYSNSFNEGKHVCELSSDLLDPRGFTIRHFPMLGANMTVKSSVITKANKKFWHVGHDDVKQNSFILADGILLQVISGLSLNAMADCSYSGNDNVIMIGDKGRILSTRSDLTLKTSVRTIDLTKLSVYPNPCSTSVTVDSSDDEIAVLSNMLGQTLKQFRLEQGRNEFSVVDLKPGIYFLSTKQNTFKLIKQ